MTRILDILILQDKTLVCAFEAGNIACWLVNPPIAKLDLFKSADCRWICKTYAEYCYRNSATVRRLVQSPTSQSTIFGGCPSDLRGKGIRSGVATGVAKGGGQSATPDNENLPKIGKKEGKFGKKSGKNGKKRTNREEKAKIGKFLSLCPSWQIGLATLLGIRVSPAW